jgi:hypothetical protein
MATASLFFSIMRYSFPQNLLLVYVQLKSCGVNIKVRYCGEQSDSIDVG